MKFIHCADLHLDSKMERLPSDKARIRRDEILRTFERLCLYAQDNDVRAVIIAGDMFDTPRVTLKTRGRVLQAISSAKDVDFLYLSGNHDDDNFINETEELPCNLKVFNDEWTSFDYDDVVISGVKLSVVNSSSVYDTLNLDEKKFNIVTLHGQVVGYKSSDNAETISIPRLKDKNIDYLALGHIHGYSEGQIDLRGKYAYCGCLEGRGFDETGDKGFVLVDVNEKKASYQFVNFSSRNLYEVEFDVGEFDSWFTMREHVVNELSLGIKNSSLVKIILTGGHAIDFDIDKDAFADKLNDLFFFAKVYDKTELKYDINDYINNKSVLGEFVRAVHESNMDELTKRRVIMCGINAIKGEEF